MHKKMDQRTGPRIAHYFRSVDLTSESRPDFIPEAFPMNFQYDDEHWSPGFLLRAAVRLQHILATFGIREGERTIHSAQPAVCFASLSLADLIAVRDGFSPQNDAATQYALTLPVAVGERGGIHPVVESNGGRARPEDRAMHESQEDKSEDAQLKFKRSRNNDGAREWRWQHAGNYSRRISKIEMDGWEGHTIPGLKLSQKKWSGIGVVVPDMVSARALQYDIISLIDRKIISETQFDHILVCEYLPESIEGLSEDEVRIAFANACYDFKSCLNLSAMTCCISPLDFKARVLQQAALVPKKPNVEEGGCWLWFEDNTHEYVRALVKADLVKVNKHGRYLASLGDVIDQKDLREREKIALKLSSDLQNDFGIRSTYFSVLNSGSFDDIPFFSGEQCGGAYYVADVTADVDLLTSSEQSSLK